MQAEFMQKYAHKGDRIAIVGKLLNNNYERDGQMVYTNDIQVENIELLNPRSTTEKKEMNVEEINKKLEDIGVDVEFLN